MSETFTPSMRRSFLIAALRDKTLWPDGFMWNFASCQTCAMGLLAKLSKDEGVSHGHSKAVDWAAARLGLPRDAANDLFNPMEEAPRNRFGYRFTCLTQITPAMVADRLERVHRKIESAALPSRGRELEELCK